MASHSILADDYILELLGDGTNSELSDLSDEDDEYFKSSEFDCLMTNFDDGDFNLLLDEDDDKEDEIVPVNTDPVTRYQSQNQTLRSATVAVDQSIDTEVENITVTNEITETNTPTTSSLAYIDKCNIRWKKQPFVPPKITLKKPRDRLYPNSTPTPLDYFLKYFPESEFENMANYTNTYAEQIGRLNWKPTNSKEMKIFVGIHLYMGVLNLPRIRMYWEQKSRINTIADNMTRNRFFELRFNFHVIDNNTIPTNNTDRFIKVRPLYDLLKKICNELPVEKNISVDEQMVPFKGKLSAKQYMRGKPNPWGIKLFLLCGEDGLVYNFIIYQGSTTELNQDMQKKYGLGSAVVLHLTDLLGKNQHFLFMDNFFTSYNLLHALQHKQIFAAGTIRVNRFVKPPFLTDKELSKMGRGTTFEGLQMKFLGMIKKKKKYILINRPEIVKLYNQSMGGVDKHDQLVSYFRTFIKSRKWTLRMVTHAFDMATVNSWLEYKMD
eukprot:XP_016658970.1 PREDICTED: piggyBac transposable element-derived protein 3-like isoform X2 [Acyrthosiphon pisum]